MNEWENINEIIYLYREENNDRFQLFIDEYFNSNIYPFLKKTFLNKKLCTWEIEDLKTVLYQKYIELVNKHNYKKENKFFWMCYVYLKNICLNDYKKCSRFEAKFKWNSNLALEIKIAKESYELWKNKETQQKNYNLRKIKNILDNSKNKLIKEIYDYKIDNLTFKEIAEIKKVKPHKIIGAWYRFVNKVNEKIN